MPAQLQLLLVQGRRREFLPSSHSRHSDASFVSSSTIQVRVRVRPITRLAGGAPEQARADSPPAQAERRAEAQQQLLDRIDRVVSGKDFGGVGARVRVGVGFREDATQFVSSLHR